MQPIWKEILQFDITTENDVVTINVINDWNNSGDILVEKQFKVGEDQYEDDLAGLKWQKKCEAVIMIENNDQQEVGQVKYVATWIYNKQDFLERLLLTMTEERQLLIDEIRSQDKKMQLISKPFGGYKNILEIDDIYFEDEYMPSNVKNLL